MVCGSLWSRRALATVGILGLVFLTVPLLIVVPMSFSSARALTFPPPGFSLRWYEAFFGDPRWMDAMWTSAALAALSSIAALVLGTLAAYGLRRGSFAARDGAACGSRLARPARWRRAATRMSQPGGVGETPTAAAVATLLIGLTVLALAALTVILGRAGKLRQTLA